ncbi:hypothetical protein PF010_g3026 [Phytophthora fragariae]|uniref:Uncharacterized protein n=1 Tax=Phytophthora fragariae TaxID=53985 RepID=A0A6A3T5P9_9STRA|nr:hypothetical protein PF003_g16966 [Phytophthora fragariae]KAE8941132.1 hypothetical protein PF009_g9069 [Phytophthora fragariae]KAE9127347.1 hypothetical protein PF007_g5642 [Phytophthora fragariae]KAE9132890.1 hypothetical protein PF010_g3026 [Phytophthora fragariae]KAE9149889.1 hypothetical protein PF006_g5668 [Phytophthora fragariae]
MEWASTPRTSWRAKHRQSSVRGLRNSTLSWLNCHAVVTRGNVGLSKTALMKRDLHNLVSDCQPAGMPVVLEEYRIHELLEGIPIFVLDCIDEFDTKIAVVRANPLRSPQTRSSAKAARPLPRA